MAAMSLEDITPDTKDWTWVLERACPECGFVAADVQPAEVADRLRDNAERWRIVLAREQVGTRPAPTVWSPLEYGCHVRDVHVTMLGRVRLMLEEDAPTFPSWDQDAAAIAGRYAEQEPASVVDEVVSSAASAAATYDEVSGPDWDRPGLRSNGTRFTVASLARYHLHDVVHHLSDVGERA
jgi:DinB superfamily